MKNFFLLIVLLFIPACEVTTEMPVLPELTELMPLEKGNYWIYQEQLLYPNGDFKYEVRENFGFIIRDTVRVKINGVWIKHYKLNCCYENRQIIDYSNLKPYDGTKLIYQNGNGIYYSAFMIADTLKRFHNERIFGLPAGKGAEYDGHLFFYSPSGNYLNFPDSKLATYTCIAKDSSFVTPVEKFNCIVFRTSYEDNPSDKRMDVYYYIEPNVGIVGIVHTFYDYKKTTTTFYKRYVLTKYNIN